MSAAADVRMTLPARPEGVAVVRQALAGMADALDFDPAVLADMKMAVSEACTNVVVHAYDDGDDGLLEVEMAADEQGLTIRVRDHGAGMDPETTRTRDVPALGLGLPLIAALSDDFELSGATGEGTEVRMLFNYARDGDPAAENPVQGTVGADGRWDPGAASEAGAGYVRPA
jgi:serine/threonine-protein kinase RsbW